MRFSRFLLSLTVLFFANACSNKKYLSSASSETLLIADTLHSEAKADSIITPYKSRIDKAVTEKLITSEIDFDYKKPGGSLGYFIADILAEEAQKETSKNIDLVFLNSNSIHPSEFKKGIISTGQIYEAIPHNYNLVYCQMKGKDIKKLFDKVIEKNDGIISKNASVFLSKITGFKAFSIHSLPIEDEQTYHFVTTDFIFYGGEGYQFSYENSTFLKIKMRDAVIANLKEKHLNRKKIDQEIYDRIFIQ